MQVEYDKVADSVYFRLKGNDVAESVEIAEGVVIDYDSKGEICGIEVLAFSKRDLDLNRLVRLRDEELVAEVATA
ncbi:MAG: DUF2283 domain-containing protein [Candidatus Thorarchaeota archaeon]|nr:DUF2283 domain-containing protein [Candidatus Thorarchaeota archaeon]